MAARNFTGSAWIGAAGNRLGTTKISAELADIAARVKDIRAVVISAKKTLRAQNLRVRTHVAAASGQLAFDPLNCIARTLGQARRASFMRLVAAIAILCHGGCSEGRLSLN